MNKQRVNLFLDPEVVKIAKAQALKENSSLSEFIEKTLRKILPSEVKIAAKNRIIETLAKNK